VGSSETLIIVLKLHPRFKLVNAWRLGYNSLGLALMGLGKFLFVAFGCNVGKD